MHSQNRRTGMVVGVVMGVLFSAVVVLAGGLEPGGGPTQGGSSSAPVPRTGQTPTVPFAAPAGSDGDLQKGMPWPNPRFTDNNNGTVTDNLTGLIWLKEANCKDMVGGIDKSLDFGKLSWAKALTWSNNLAGGECSLNDGSTAGQWRLPNVREMHSLIHYGFSFPALSNTDGSGRWTEGAPFTGVQSDNYWSSTTYAVTGPTGYAWNVGLPNGHVSNATKAVTYYVWPVRGGPGSQGNSSSYLPILLKAE